MAFEGIQAAVVGCGKWGMNHVKTAYQLLGPQLKFACDAFDSAKDRVAAVGNINFTKNLEDILKDEAINAVIIATPAETHYKVALACLEHGKHVLVEKPITLVSSEAEHLNKVAEERGLNIMVGHVLLYHPAILKIKSDLEAGRLGKLQYIYCNRLNLGTIRSEENILWSFAPHDISIIQFFTGTNPVSVEAHGAKFVQQNIEDTTITYLHYPDNVHAHIFVSWLHPFKEQRLVVIGDKGMYSFEDTLKEGKLKFYPKGFTSVGGVPQKFEGEYEVVAIETKQPLAEEQSHFFNSILTKTKPLTDG
ncbi:MAG: Gfo/Idh/MocA family oxidoreductase, partial [Ignavibacteriales bacterium]|nr:Gfo/Idh/MocA family oxidoreductase [Ignavibacteriales bacterium]